MKKLSFGFLVFLLWSSQAVAQAPYFQGKTIRVIVGYPAGSAHDIWARLVAAEAIHGDELEAPAKEVLSQPTEIIAAMKKVMGQ